VKKLKLLNGQTDKVWSHNKAKALKVKAQAKLEASKRF
jgi:hypothetical protein